jgi:hypothetical protein
MKTYIPNSKNYYVDVMGNVYSQYRKLNQNNQHTGYKTVTIRYKDGTVKSEYVHRLVAKAFLANPNNLPVVNHKNLDKADNRVENLEWCSYKENSKHTWENNANRLDDGTAYWAKYTKQQIVRVCEMLSDGRRNIEIEKETKVSKSDVFMIRSRRNWTHISKDYIFREKSRQRKVSEQTIRWVCLKIVEGKSNLEIAELLNNKLTRQDICKIKTGMLYSDIASEYFTFK